MFLSFALATVSFAPLQDASGLPPIGDLGGAVWATLADLDRDGNSTMEEWKAFQAALGTDGDPTVAAFELELFLQGIERDVPRIFDVLDANDDGLIERAELRGKRLSGANPVLQQSYVNRLARLMLLETADVDGNGRITEEEQAPLVQAWAAEATRMDAVRGWIEASKAREPEDRNAMTPGVTMHTLAADIDPDQNGRIDWSQLQSWFDQRDANGDGALDGNEIRIRASFDESWRRVTAERRAMPPIMPWQRNLRDALAVQARTGQPLFICVNMDGETASDSLAHWRYRDPGFVRLASGFVCLVVSPDDHSPRDYDDRGRRMVSPRLGSVTDAEHIDLEPTLYERYFGGRRVAPRHVGVAPDGSVLFDIFLTNDATRIDDALRQHGVNAPALDFAAMATSELERYPDAAARTELERRMAVATPDERLAMLGGAGASPDLAILGLRDADARVREAAVKSLASEAQWLSRAQLDRLVRAADRIDPAVAANVLETLTWAGRSSTGARRAAVAWRSATDVSSIGSIDAWTAAASLAVPSGAAPDTTVAFARLDAIDAALGSRKNAEHASLLRATALFQVGEALAAEGQDPTDALSEAITAAKAAAAGRDTARAMAIVASASHALGDSETAVRAAHAALPELLTAQSDPLVVRTLRALQDSCTRRVYASMGAGEPFRGSDVADAVLAGRTLIAHPAGTERDATQLMTLLATVGDVVATPVALDRALRRFPANAELHQRLRADLLASEGSTGVAARYALLRRNVEDKAMAPTLRWYEGLAELVAAEWDVQQAESAGALGHYEASLVAFESALEGAPEFADSANHYRVLALAGAATLQAGSGDGPGAVERLLACATLRPDSLGLKDGLGRTPKERAATLADTVDDATRAAILAAFEAVEQPLQ